MAVQTVEQVQRLAPYLEGLEKRLLQSAFGTFDGDKQTSQGLLDAPLNLPQFQVAGLDPLQQQALSAACTRDVWFIRAIYQRRRGKLLLVLPPWLVALVCWQTHALL